jgi:5'-deoxynucleotidase YfbR-like HD superfamily hydrolase
MADETNMQEILEKVEFLFKHYSLERRAITQPYLLGIVKEQVPNYTYHPEDKLVRETLLEHVGSLPVLATALYPYINDEEVHLGDALTMLAIHDIGELVIGDENVFTKKSDRKHAEHEAAQTLLHPYYHRIYEDVENKTSKSAKFAKAIDKIAPDILDYITPAHITKQRLKHFANFEPEEIVAKITEFKRPYMTWNTFMTELHIHLMEQLEVKLKQ